jgi:aryl-alcohol dehydrogenase-like predicted oxidoreductase
MRNTTLGRTGIEVSPVAFGTGSHGLLSGTMSEGTTFAPDDWRSHSPLFQVAIVGARRPEHFQAAIGAAELDLDAEDLAPIEEIMSGAVALAGPSPESV